MIARIKVPHGKLQFTPFGRRPLSLLSHGPLVPPFGLVRTATAMKPPTKPMSKIIHIQRNKFDAPPLRQNLRSIEIKVYATAAARIPSTAPLDVDAR
jgi:hypothetical protein